jgi:replicative DNA helicase
MNKEQYILGACLLDDKSLNKARSILQPNDFTLENNQQLFADMIELSETTDVDVVSLSNFSTVESSYIAGLPEDIITFKHVEDYAVDIKHESQKRKIYKKMSSITSNFSEMSLDDMISHINNGLLPLTRVDDKIDEKMNVIMMNTVKDIEDTQEGKKTYVKTGFKYLDYKILGFEPSEVYVIAGRPASGKTALGLNIVANILQSDKDKKVALFSLEMDRNQIAKRLIAAKGLVEMNKIRKGNLDSDNWERIMHTSDFLAKSNLVIKDKEFQLSGIINSIKQEKPDIVFIDYLQLINGGSHNNKNAEVTYISRAFKEIAMALNIPIVLISQLSRSCEQRTDKRPQMSDLRDSGSIEQDASTIMLLYRDAYYYRDSEMMEFNTKTGEYTSDIAEVNVVKQRNGETGMVKLRWIPKWTRFTDYEEEESS